MVFENSENYMYVFVPNVPCGVERNDSSSSK